MTGSGDANDVLRGLTIGNPTMSAANRTATARSPMRPATRRHTAASGGITATSVQRGRRRPTRNPRNDGPKNTKSKPPEPRVEAEPGARQIDLED